MGILKTFNALNQCFSLDCGSRSCVGGGMWHTNVGFAHPDTSLCQPHTVWLFAFLVHGWLTAGSLQKRNAIIVWTGETAAQTHYRHGFMKTLWHFVFAKEAIHDNPSQPCILWDRCGFNMWWFLRVMIPLHMYED